MVLCKPLSGEEVFGICRLNLLSAGDDAEDVCTLEGIRATLKGGELGDMVSSTTPEVHPCCRKRCLYGAFVYLLKLWC